MSGQRPLVRHWNFMSSSINVRRIRLTRLLLVRLSRERDSALSYLMKKVAINWWDILLAVCVSNKGQYVREGPVYVFFANYTLSRYYQCSSIQNNLTVMSSKPVNIWEKGWYLPVWIKPCSSLTIALFVFDCYISIYRVKATA